MSNNNLRISILRIICLIELFHFNAQAQDLTNEEGNHTWAKSESWTWMGHLNEYKVVNGAISIQENGIALIHYYTRNQTQAGSLNFKSSALTFTKNGIGEIYDKNTIYSDSMMHKNKFKLKIQEKQLNINFKYKDKLDVIKKEDITEEDLQLLQNLILPAYSGLKITESFKPIKYKFSANVGSQSYLDLNLYQIWPSISPKDAKMQFLGIPDAYTFSQPMLVAIGTYLNNYGIQKPVVGLMFLDRQWCKDYFGKNIMGNPIESVKQNQALLYSHNWSAFHAHSEVSNNWYFIHLWKQFQRPENLNDKIEDYTGIVWVKNGMQQNPIERGEFEWTGYDFIKNKSNVLLNYAVDRESYFPTSYLLNNKINNDHLNLIASPKLQSLDQPIYLYEGYATGNGIWNGETVSLKGLVESSRILFRVQDYKEVVAQILDPNYSHFTNRDEQNILAVHLNSIIEDEEKCKNNFFCFDQYLHNRQAQWDYIMNDLKQKLKILQSGFDPKSIERDIHDSSIIVYH